MMESHIKLVIFDLDGTLVDSLAELVAAANYVHSVFGLPMLDECEVRKCWAEVEDSSKDITKAGRNKKAHKSIFLTAMIIF